MTKWNDDSLTEGKAVLTAQGVFYAGSYYSCAEALKAGWYEGLSHREDDRKELIVHYNRGDYPPLAIWVEVEEQPVMFRVLKKSVSDPSAAEAYHHLFQAMKKERQSTRA